MKNPSGDYTYTRTTSAECFRAIATGVGPTLAGSEASGEVRKAMVAARGNIGKAPKNEGFGPAKAYKRDWRNVGGPSSLDSSDGTRREDNDADDKLGPASTY
jgi:hypothetical protein